MAWRQITRNKPLSGIYRRERLQILVAALSIVSNGAGKRITNHQMKDSRGTTLIAESISFPQRYCELAVPPIFRDMLGEFVMGVFRPQFWNLDVGTKFEPGSEIRTSSTSLLFCLVITAN